MNNNISTDLPIDSVALASQNENASQQTEVVNPPQDVDYYNGRQLLDMAITEIPTLVDPIIPKVPIIALIGTSDIGKSTLLLQLCEDIVLHQEFLGFNINAKYKSTIYVSTEDDHQIISQRMVKRLANENDATLQNVQDMRFLFTTEDLEKRLDKELSTQKADLVVIDTFSDIFSGEMNRMNQVRCFMSKYFDLAIKHDCTIIFNHHTKKDAEEKAPSKHNSIGSAGFEGKARLVMELRADYKDVTKRHLCIVKGNYLAPEYKAESFELDFNKNLGFTNTGNRIDFNLLVKPSTTRPNDERAVLKGMVIALHQEGKSIRQIVKELAAKGHTVTRSSVHSWIKGLSVQNSPKQDLDAGQEDGEE